MLHDQASTDRSIDLGTLTAISALGLGTSLTAIAPLGWRHVATVTGTTLVILAVVTVGLTSTAVKQRRCPRSS